MSEIPAWLQELRNACKAEPKGRLAQLREIAATGEPQIIENVQVPKQGAEMILSVYDNLLPMAQEQMAHHLGTDFKDAARTCAGILEGKHLENIIKGIFQSSDSGFDLKIVNLGTIELHGPHPPKPPKKN